MTNEVLSYKKQDFFLKHFVLYLDNIRYTTFTISETFLLQIFIVFHSSYKEKGAQYRVTFRMSLQYFSSQKFQILEEWVIFNLF